MLTNYNDIKAWLDETGIKFYKIRHKKDTDNTDNPFVVDVSSLVDISHRNLKEIPVQFGVIIGSFNCSHNKLTSLKGSPFEVALSFNCHHNLLKTLQYAPIKIGEDCFCNDNELSNLKGLPSQINSDFDCRNNQLTNIKDFPHAIAFCCNFYNGNKIELNLENISGINCLAFLFNGVPEALKYYQADDELILIEKNELMHMIKSKNLSEKLNSNLSVKNKRTIEKKINKI